MTPRERALAAQERIADALEGILDDQRAKELEAERDERRRRMGSRSEPRTLNLLDACRTVNGFAGAWKTIPGEFWVKDVGMVLVSCPCGSEAEVRDGWLDTPGVPRACQGDGCERTYCFDGRDVRVFSPATLKPFLEAAEAADNVNTKS